MNEHRRMEYVQAMGISMYVPRCVLPGARPSVAADLPMMTEADIPEETILEETFGEVVVPAPQPRAIEGVVGGIMNVLAPEPKTTVQPKKALPSTPTPPSAHRPEDAEPVAPFALSIWRPSAALMVLDSRHNRQALPTQGLLQNILQAKDIRGFAARSDILNWPPVAGVHNPGGWPAAREMTQAFLHARLDREPAQYLWLMGERAFRAVVADDKPYVEMLGQAINLDQMSVLALVLPGLADMLLEPSLKAITWAAIRAHYVG